MRTYRELFRAPEFMPLFLASSVPVVIASVGYCASLLLQERLMALTQDEVSGQALGLVSSGMLAMQGAGAAVAGVVAQLSSPGAAMAAMAAVSLAVTLILAPGLRPAVHDRDARSAGRTARQSEHSERGNP